MVIALISVQWMLLGYSLSFGPTVGGIIGDLSWVGLKGVGSYPTRITQKQSPSGLHDLSGDVCRYYPALLMGAIAERMKFKAFLFLRSLEHSCL